MIDLNAPVHARRKAIDWNRVHLDSDARAPIGMMPRLTRRPSLFRAIAARFQRGVGDTVRVEREGRR